MRRTIGFIFLFCAAFFGCVAPPPQLSTAAQPDGLEVTVIMARAAIKGRGPLGVADRFTLDGNIVAYISLKWTDLNLAWGPIKLESRWYKGDRLISKREDQYNFTRQPTGVWASIYPAVLGPGEAKYEVYWNGLKLAQRQFEIVGTNPEDEMREPVVKSL